LLLGWSKSGTDTVKLEPLPPVGATLNVSPLTSWMPVLVVPMVLM